LICHWFFARNAIAAQRKTLQGLSPAARAAEALGDPWAQSA